MLEKELIVLDRLITLREIKNAIDLNYLHKNDLENLQYVANKLDIQIANFDLERNYEEKDLYDIYNLWSAQINLMCKQKRKQIVDDYDV